jgi:hypothetical protein
MSGLQRLLLRGRSMSMVVAITDPGELGSFTGKTRMGP